MFKKILVAVMALSLCTTALITSCNENKEGKSIVEDVIEDVVDDVKEKSAEEIINESVWDKAVDYEQFDAIKSLEDSISDGSIYAKLNFGEVALNNTLTVNEEKSMLFDNLTIGNDESATSVNLFFNGKEFAIKGDFLGEDVYGLSIENIEENTEKSELWNLLGISYDDVKEAVNEILSKIELPSASIEENQKLADDFKKEITKIIKAQKAEYAIEDVELYDGTIKAAVGNYAIDNAFIEKLFDVEFDYLKKISQYDIMNSSLEQTTGQTFDEAIQEFKDAIKTVEFDGTLKIAVNIATGDVVLIDMDMTGTEVREEKAEEADSEVVDDELQTANVKFKLDLGKNPKTSTKVIADVLVVDDEKEVAKLGITLEAIESEDNTEYVLTINAEEEETEKTTIAISLKYYSEEKAYALTVTEDENELASISGMAGFTDDKLLFTVEKVIFDGEELEDFYFELTTDSENEVPDMPEYKEILSLSVEEYSAFFETIGSMFGSSDDYDDWEDEDWEWDEDWEDEDWEWDEDWEDEDWDNYDWSEWDLEEEDDGFQAA